MSIRRFVPTQNIRASALNNLVDGCNKANNLTAQPPLEITDTSLGKQIRLNQPPSVMVKVVGFVGQVATITAGVNTIPYGTNQGINVGTGLWIGLGDSFEEFVTVTAATATTATFTAGNNHPTVLPAVTVVLMKLSRRSGNKSSAEQDGIDTSPLAGSPNHRE